MQSRFVLIRMCLVLVTAWSLTSVAEARDEDGLGLDCPVVYSVPGTGQGLTCDDLVEEHDYTCASIQSYGFDCRGCTNCDEPKFASEQEVVEVVVTGTRTAVPLEESPVATEVIRREDIARSGAEDLSELLEEHPGIDLRRTVFGASVRMQGLDPKHVLILVDGVRVLGAKGGEIDLSRFPIENIERVEIVKGPGSVQYGSDAMAGTINIITREPEQPFAARLRGRYGGNQSLDTVASVDLKGERVSSQLVGGYHRSAGYDLDPSNVATNASAFQWFDASHNTRWRVAPTLTLGTSASYLRRDLQGVDLSATGAVFDRSNRIEDFRTTLTPRWTPNSKSTLTSVAAFSLYKDQYLSDQRGSDALDQYQVTLERVGQTSLQYDRRLATDHQLSVGIEGLSQYLESDRLADGVGQRFRGAVFLLDHVSFPVGSVRLTLLPGARVDSDTWFGTYFTPNMAARAQLSRGVAIRASYGLGYRAPDFKEMFIYFENPGVGYVVEGNPDLRPETSKGTQVGVDLGRRSDTVAWSTNAFLNQLDDLIAYGTLEEASLGRPARYGTINIAEATTRGVENILRLRWTALKLNLGYTFLDGKNQSQDRPLEGRAAHRGSVKLDTGVEAWGLGWMTRAAIVGPRPYYIDTDGDGEEDVFETDVFATVDSRVSLKTWARTEVFIGVDNLLNAGDQTFIAIAPRRMYAGLTGTIGQQKSRDNAPSEPSEGRNE